MFFLPPPHRVSKTRCHVPVGMAVLSVCALSLLTSILSAQEKPDPLGFHAKILPLIEDHCITCHGEGKTEGNIDFTKLDTTEAILNFSKQWLLVRDVVDFGDMPPKPEKSGWSPTDRQAFLDWIETTVENPDPENPLYRNPGPPFLRQLNVSEYLRTVRDLLGIEVDASQLAGFIPQAPVSGFSTYAQGVAMDPILLENYLKASQAVIGQFFGDESLPWASSPDKDRLAAQASAARAALLLAEPGKNGASVDRAARENLLLFVRKAYRRPVKVTEISRFEILFKRSIASGDNFTNALRKAMVPVLVSPNFIYRFETNPETAETAPYPINQHELAVRLSYFIWSSMPDDTLFQLASNGTLAQPEVLREQVRRMLQDPKAKALTEIFASEWLHLAKLNNALPSREIYPQFDDAMKASMRAEVYQFIDDLRINNGSILNLIHSDYTFVDKRLATLYGIEGTFPDDSLVRTELKPKHQRGGLLGMGAILAMTSHVDRTKPTARGDWILGVMLGEPPPPPPANVGAFAAPDPNRPPPANFREQIERHATDPQCVTCHKKIDPLGFSLENFDPIGAWRTKIGNNSIDNLGTLPTGESIIGVDGLKTVLDSRKDDFTRNLFGRALSYAVGRELLYFDRPVVNQAISAIKKDNHSFESLILSVVESYPFLHRNPAPVSTSASNP